MNNSVVDFINLSGVIKNVRYDARVRLDELKHYPLASFDINTAKSFGIIDLDDSGNLLGYSKWVSPKRTRSYPFARIYNTYHLPKKITIIPVIKDEGLNGDNDRINFITFSWMSLMNVYVILAWYDTAQVSSRKAGKITSQKFDVDYVKTKIKEISTYHQTALHWNVLHFERDFEQVYRQAVRSYEAIAQKTGIAVHSSKLQLAELEKYLLNGKFSRAAFKLESLDGSFKASQRELLTQHKLERLLDGQKGYFSITNMLGGEYHLTADEIHYINDSVIIQESKNASTGKMPSLADIQDGLFKLILFANMDELILAGEARNFSPRLKLTGSVTGILNLPAQNSFDIDTFIAQNKLSRPARRLISFLNDEAQLNTLDIQICGNT